LVKLICVVYYRRGGIVTKELSLVRLI